MPEKAALPRNAESNALLCYPANACHSSKNLSSCSQVFQKSFSSLNIKNVILTVNTYFSGSSYTFTPKHEYFCKPNCAGQSIDASHLDVHLGVLIFFWKLELKFVVPKTSTNL